MRIAIVACVAALACSRTETAENYRPFQTPEWTSMPSPEVVVRAVVGNGGDWTLRKPIEAAVRDLFVPHLSHVTSLAHLELELESIARGYEEELALHHDPYRAMVYTLVAYELEFLAVNAMHLAEARLQATLWPDEPPDERWSKIEAVRGVDYEVAARDLQRRLDELQRRYGRVLPGVFDTEAPEFGHPGFGLHRSVALVRNNLHVARNGDVSTTHGPVYDVLKKRGVRTSRHLLQGHTWLPVRDDEH